MSEGERSELPHLAYSWAVCIDVPDALWPKPEHTLKLKLVAFVFARQAEKPHMGNHY